MQDHATALYTVLYCASLSYFIIYRVSVCKTTPNCALSNVPCDVVQVDFVLRMTLPS